jgi:hypothetical protein
VCKGEFEFNDLEFEWGSEGGGNSVRANNLRGHEGPICWDNIAGNPDCLKYFSPHRKT